MENHRVAEVTSGDCLVQYPCSEHVSSAGCPGPSQVGYEYLQGWRLHSFSRQSALVFDHRHAEVECFFVFQFVLVASSLNTTEKSLALSSLLPERNHD